MTNIVNDWLNNVGLNHVIPEFESKGIANANDLVKLKFSDYATLGVVDSDDRKKLYYLIQRTKMEIGRESPCRKNESKVSLGLDESNLNDSCISDKTDFGKNETKIKPMRRSARLQKMKESREYHVDLHGRLLKMKSPSSSSPIKAHLSSIIPISNFDSDEKNDSNYESSEPIADYDISSRTTMYDKENARSVSLSNKSTRRSIEPRNKLYQMHNSPSKVDSKLQHTVLTYASPGGHRKAKVSSSLPEIKKLPMEYPKSPKISHKSSTKTPSIDQKISSSITSSSANSRLSYSSMNKPNTSSSLMRSKSNTKRLTSIPSERALPMSPLTTSQFDDDGGIGNINSFRSKSRERSSSRDRRISAPIQISKIETSKSQTDHAKSNVPSRRTISRDTNRQRCNSSSSRHSTGSYRTSSARSVSSADSRRSSKSSASKIFKSASSDAPFFVHGTPVDKSWGSQVQNLREINEDMYRKDISNQNQTQQLGEMRIRVAVRKRPISSDGEIDVIHPIDCDGHGKIICYQPKTRVDLTKEIETMKFSFDNVFDEHATNVDIYRATARDLIPGVFAGEWATVFAYGQTGSGKTFTMMGSGLTGMKAGNQAKNNNSNSNLGLYYLAAQDLFRLAQTKYPNIHIGASLFEIYSGKLYDLLNNRKAIKCLEDHRGKVCFPGLSEHPVSNANRLMQIIESGAANRSTGSTSANADSSRSHAVLQLCLRKNVGKKQNVEHGRLTFIDLAGSERGADTYQSSRTTRLEGAEINTSLLALKEVIRALATGDSMSHIPFRGSKLTQVLKQSFVGTNSRTVMIACVAPDIRHCEHTLNTLRYADRVKERDAETGEAVVDAMIYAKPSASPKRDHYPTSAHTLKAKSNINRYSDEEDDNGQSEGQYEWDNNDDWSSEGSDVNGDHYFEEKETKKKESLKLLADEVNSDDCSYASSLASCNETKADSVRAESHEKVARNGPSREPFHVTANKLIGTHRSITTNLLKITKKDMLLVNNNDISNRSEFDSYLNNLESLQVQQLDLIKELRETLVEFYSKRRGA